MTQVNSVHINHNECRNTGNQLNHRVVCFIFNVDFMVFLISVFLETDDNDELPFCTRIY